MKKKLVTGVKPTGRPHLGNYFGVLEHLKGYENEYDLMIFIANYHALTTIQDKEKLEEYTLELMAIFLSIGLDPKKTTFFKQSDVPQVTELSCIFSNLATMPYLMRAHSYKDAQAKNKEINAGTFNYPLLMAADILLSGADIVPVGKDQKQHVEITRDMARKFNQTYGDTFKEPQEKVVEEKEAIIGIDGQKMSKNYNNTIPLFATRKEIEKIVMGIATDSKGIDEPKDPDNNLLYKVHEMILEGEAKTELRRKYEEPGLSYKDAKQSLIEDLDEFIKPFREKKEELEKNPRKVKAIYEKGSKKMRKLAEQKMGEVRSKVGL